MSNGRASALVRRAAVMLGGNPIPTVTPEPAWPPVDTSDPTLGTVTREPGSVYTQSVSEVLRNPQANWCATYAWDELEAAVPGWAASETRDAAASQYETNSSTEIWNQVAEAGELPAPVALTVGESSVLAFEALEATNSDAGTQPLTSISSLPIGETVAVVMRPLDAEGLAAAATGHWVLVERLDEDTFVVRQSAPGNWVLTGEANPTGGVFASQFSGPEAAAQVSAYLHQEAAFASSSQNQPGYGLVVLAPVAASTAR